MNKAIGAKTDVGRTRQVNEDSYLVQDPLFVVADGMGGHVAGDVASRTVVEKLTEETRGDTPTPESLAPLVRAANAEVFNKARSDSTLQGMGTTCTILLLEGTDAHLAHVGDSRAYLFRDQSLRQITEDHTLVQRMVQEGRLSQEEAHKHPQRNIITRVLGVDPDVSVDTFSVEAKPGDRFLLCSDGLSSMLEDAEIEAVLRSESEPQAAAELLVARANEAGGEDNITVVIVAVGDSDSGAATNLASATGGRPAGSAPPSSRASEADDLSDRQPPAEARPLSGDAGRGESWKRVVVGVVLVLGILLAATYIGVRYLWIERSFYVGVNEAGAVTIYRGVPQDVAGMTLRREEEITPLQADELPEFLQDDVAAGIEVASLNEAQQRVVDLVERAADAESERSNPTNTDGDKDSSGGNNS